MFPINMLQLLFFVAILIIIIQYLNHNKKNIIKPYKILIVSGTQMKDDRIILNAGNFGDITALLILWGIPFDTVRLDTTSMTMGMFIDQAGNPKYSLILWTACQDEYPWQPQDYSILTRAVTEYGINLIVVGDCLMEKNTQDLLGLSYEGRHKYSEPLKLTLANHFITRELSKQEFSTKELFPQSYGPKAKVTNSHVSILGSSDGVPLITVRQKNTGKAIQKFAWLGEDSQDIFSRNPVYIHILQRMIIWAMDIVIYKDFNHSIILRMDDPGSAQTAYLKSWHYSQLTQDQIDRFLITPLLDHQASLVISFCPGYPWIPTRTVEKSVCIDFVDPFGARQNLKSTYAGLLEGIDKGVLEIQNHGLTHQVPDLDTPIPGSTNWWDGSPEGEWAVEGWYREFYDTRRNQDIDAAVQKEHISLSDRWIEKDFGVKPVAFLPGGLAITGGRFNTGEINIQLTGAEPWIEYEIFYVLPENHWKFLAKIQAHENGQGLLSLPEIARLTYFPGLFFAVVHPAKGVQFLSDPLIQPTGESYELKLHKVSHGSREAQQIVFAASQDSFEGKISGIYGTKSNQILENFTYRIAADEGYGLAVDVNAHYLGDERIIQMRAINFFHPIQSHFDRSFPAMLFFHDRDIVNDNHWLKNQLDHFKQTWPDVSYLRLDEWTAYLHAQNDVEYQPKGNIQISINYPFQYCGYMQNHSSTWTHHFSDEMLRKVRSMGKMEIVVDEKIVGKVDSKKYFKEVTQFTVPPGCGTHTITLRPVIRKD